MISRFIKLISLQIKVILLYLIIRLLALTWRITVVNPDKINPRDNKNQKIIFPFWHGRLLLPTYFYRNLDVYGIISRSSDGDLMAGFAGLLGYSIVRGSTSRGGKEAFRMLARAMDKGHNIGLAPDGPRGPAGIVQTGVIQLARFKGRYIVPLTFSASHYKRFASWDQFILPLPFSKIVIVFGKTVEVCNGLGDLEIKRMELEQEMNRITQEADEYFQLDK